MVVPEYNANAVERGRTRVDRVDKIITALHSISGVEFSLLKASTEISENMVSTRCLDGELSPLMLTDMPVSIHGKSESLHHLGIGLLARAYFDI